MDEIETLASLIAISEKEITSFRLLLPVEEIECLKFTFYTL